MRHRNYGRKFGLPSGHRKHMLRQLVQALFLHGRIKTTVTRAKDARPIAERIITWGKKGTLHHRRLALAIIQRTDIIDRIFTQLAEWYRNRPGGYTRIIKLDARAGDGAPMAYWELVDWIPGEKLEGQHPKQEKKVEGEEGVEAKAEKKAKPEAEKKAKNKGSVKKSKPAKISDKPKSPKDAEKEKKKADRKAALDKHKAAKAEERKKHKEAATAGKHAAKAEVHKAKPQASDKDKGKDKGKKGDKKK